jgi:hypothetical protein
MVRFRNNPLRVEVNGKKVTVINLSEENIPVAVYGKETVLGPGSKENFEK